MRSPGGAHADLNHSWHYNAHLRRKKGRRQKVSALFDGKDPESALRRLATGAALQGEAGDARAEDNGEGDRAGFWDDLQTQGAAL